MNIEGNNSSDCESDADYCVDGVTSDTGCNNNFNGGAKKKIDIKSKKDSVRVLRITRQSVSAESDHNNTDRDELHSDEEAEKSRSDALWADFLNDVEGESKLKQRTDHQGGNADNINSKPENKKRSRLGTLKRPVNEDKTGSLFNKVEKKKKTSVLEKSQMDWKNFKSDEGIDEQLRTHNKGKYGYFERQEFLQRTDLRQFEIEKNLRQSRRSN
ncbi:craniofacial development protein 1 [Drosophila takahashii]|uniref:craniofacial development protein 1 n=1 Tax=Drosophila takahashii TaxID=29030 RepID=UPI001CF8EB62|nr:craniofacial development protein 1 [Drosophila takahashii]